MIFVNHKFFIKKSVIILKINYLTEIKDKYFSVCLIIKLKSKNRAINFNNNILKIIRFTNIKKKNPENLLASSFIIFYFTIKLSKSKNI